MSTTAFETVKAAILADGDPSAVLLENWACLMEGDKVLLTTLLGIRNRKEAMTKLGFYGDWKAVTMATSNTLTCPGHGLVANQPIRFKTTGALPSMTAGILGSTAMLPDRIYFVRASPTTDTFEIAEYVGGAVVDITSTGTGTHYVDVAVAANVLVGNGLNGGAVQAQPTDSGLAGGNARGAGALDLQRERSAATQVARTKGSVILTGFGNTVTTGSGAEPTFYGSYSAVLSGFGNTLASNGRGSAIIGNTNSISGGGSTVVFLAGVQNAIMSGSGGSSTCLGDQHLGGGQNCTWLGGFHNLINTVGTTDYGAAGAQISAQGAGTLINYMGGFNIVTLGAGTVGEIQGSINFSSHANKNKGSIWVTVQYASTAAASGTVAASATSTVEMLPMGYYSGGNLKKFAVQPNRLYTLEFAAVIVLVDASTPEYGMIRKRATYFSGTTANATPTLVGSVTTIETSGSDSGNLPAGWGLVITPEAGTLTFDLTVVNHAAGARNIHAFADVKAAWVNTALDT